MSEIDAPLRATLFELGLNSDAPEKLAEFYHRALGYEFEPSSDRILGKALERRITILPGAPKTLAYAVYAVPDVSQIDALELRLRAAGVASRRIDKEGLEPGAILCADPDGNQLIFGIAQAARPLADHPNSMRPARIQHVVFATVQIEKLLDFYCRVVHFTLSDRVRDDQGQLRTAFVRCSHEHHSLAIFAAGVSRLDHFCHEAGGWDLIRDWADHFASLRIPLKWGPGRHGPGDNLFIFVHDPDGNWVEISAEMENVKPDRPVGDWPHAEYTLNTWGIGMLRS